MQGSNRSGSFMGSAPLDAGAMTLPFTTPSPARLQDTAFEVFVKRAMKSILDQATGRSSDAKKIREACQKFLESVNRGNADGPKFIPPLSGMARDQVLAPLRLACNADIPRVVEPALGCLHKLVGHAYLQGESTPAGKLEDPNLVSKITATIAKCGESSSTNVQLAVIRGLLTLTTAEHFVLHGDCLLQAVRTVFNLAIGSDAVDIQRTARNALLQMLNTIVKRVTCFSSCLSEAPSSGAHTPLSIYSAAPCHYSTGVSPRSGVPATMSRRTTVEHLEVQVDGLSVGSQNGGSSRSDGRAKHPSSGAEEVPTIPTIQVHDDDDDDQGLHPATPPGSDMAEISVIQEAGESERGRPDAPSGSVSPCSYIATEEELERSIDQMKEVITMLTPLNTPAKAERACGDGLKEAEEGAEGSQPALPNPEKSPGRSAHLMNLAEQQDLEALEAAMSEEQPGAAGMSMRPSNGSQLGRAVAVSAEQQNSRTRRSAWKELRLPERDVVTVLGALCKLAARDGQVNDHKDRYLQQGKLLALEMLVGTISSPVHQWGAVRSEFVAQLRQPLCVTLLRNCMSHDIDVVRYVTRLFSGLLLQPRLRSVMKAELGAFYPLLILRPMQAIPYNPPQLAAALHVLQGLCKESSLQVEMFMNFDCELEESNLFERTTWSLKELVDLGDPSAPPAQNQLVKSAALACVISLVRSLDSWSGPMRDKMASAAASGGVTSGSNGDLDISRLSNSGADVLGVGTSSLSGNDASEAERFGTAKQRKVTLRAGIEKFNKKPLSGISSLVSAGLIESTPESIVQFLRKNRTELDKGQVGEYLGHHEDEQIAVMHAYIDSDDFTDLRIDDALRRLLADFRLPGEAQKIDRIMEKFAERYCKDNPGLFRTADAAYLLAFAIIMLNTDAHNPMVDDKMSQEDFVLMNAAGAAGGEEGGDDSEGEVLPLPIEELHGIYDRIQENEIKMRAEGSNLSSELSNRRLVAAVGLANLMVPFRSSRSNAKAQQEQARAVLERTRHMVSQSMHKEAEWHIATQSEMVVPMLQVSGDNIQEALYCALKAARSEEECDPLIECYNVMIKLSALFGLDALCEKLVESLVKATGIASSMASPTDPNIASQLAALRALVALAGTPESGMLGSAWAHILRCLSSLDMMVHNTHYHVSARGASEPRGRSPSAPSAGNSSTFGRMLGWMRGTGGSAQKVESERDGNSSPMGTIGTPRSVDWQIRKGTKAYASPSRPGVVGQGPGARHVAWAEGEGSAEVERVFAGSAKMDGESVVVFVRAMCAVSQEELEDSARVYMLQKLVECAHHNLGRIRLVWARIWAALTPHVVGATCHQDLKVAMYAVDSLRQLVSKLLVRAELAHFTHQEEALRPFCSILRSCDSPVVRELTVQCIAQAITAHPHGLGSGWRSVLQALEVAAGDVAAPVVEQALEALQPVVEALYRGLGLRREFFPDCLSAARTAALNRHHHELSAGGLQILRTAGRRLAEGGGADPQGEEDALEHSRPSPGKGHRPSGDGASTWRKEAGPQAEWVGRHRRWRADKHEWAQLAGVLAEVAVEGHAPETVTGSLIILMEMLATHGGLLDDEAWKAVYKRSIGVLLEMPPPSLGAVQFLPDAGVAYLSPWAVPVYDRILTQGPSVLPRLFLLMSEQYDGAGQRLLPGAINLLVQYVMQPWEDVAVLGARMLQMLATTMAPSLGEDGWRAVVRGLSVAASADALQPIAGVPSIHNLPAAVPPPARAPPAHRRSSNGSISKALFADDGPGALGSPSPPPEEEAAPDEEDRKAGSSRPDGPAAPDAAAEAADGGPLSPASAALPPEAAAAPKRFRATVRDAIHVRCHIAVLIQRVIEHLHRACASTMPPRVQLQLLDVLLDTVNRAAALNTDRQRRLATAQLLGGEGVADDAEGGAEGGELEAGQWSFAGGPLLPALMRQEAEGGVLLVQALRRCMAGPDRQVAEGAAERLLALCSRVIQTAADDAVRNNGASDEEAGLPGPTIEGRPAQVADTQTTAAAVEAEEGGASPGWDEGIRGPLVVAALGAVAGLEGARGASELRALFPALTQLMCSSQPSVREALSGLLAAHLPQLLPGPPAPARGA